MQTTLVTIIIASFIGVLLLNVIFRVKILKIYKRLRKRDIKFDGSHFFSDKKLREEVLPYYPDMEDDILSFVKLIKLSTTIASILMFLIIIAALILNR